MSNEVTETTEPGFVIPIWVALAALLLALLCGVVVFMTIAEPLAELVLGRDPDIPVPDGAVLEQEVEGQGSASKEWLYRIDDLGCEVARYYVDQGADCVFTPYSCNLERQEPPEGVNFEIHEIAECTKTVDRLIAGYTWRVHITSYSSGTHTRFRIYLFE